MIRDEYMEFTSLYEGTGILNQQHCEFEVGQKSDGQIRVYCTFSESPDLVNASGVELCGRTNDGIKVCGKGPFQNRPWDVDYNTEPENYFSNYEISDLTIGKPNWSRAHSVTFTITNLLFCGNDQDSGGRGTCYNALKLQLDGSHTRFLKVDNYYDIDNTVCIGETTEVTCELAIEVDGRSRDELRKMVNRICDLLTISQGRRIEWINYKVYDANSSLIFTFHQSRRTDPRNGFVLINFQQANTAINYLELGYPAYKQFASSHPTILNGVAILMADSYGLRFTLPHALIMFSMVDALCNKVSNHDYFRGRMRDLVDHYCIPISKCSSKRCGRGCGTCKPKCKSKCKNKCESKCEINRFVKSRNCVVHDLKFKTNDSRKEYGTCYHIFHRMLLRILDYQSVYYDVSLPDQHGFQENRLHPCP